MYQIGKVVSLLKSTNSVVFELTKPTNSVVFEFNDNIEVKPPLTVKVTSSSTQVVQLSWVRESDAVTAMDHPPPPPLGKTLVGFGAIHRGFHAVVVADTTNETLDTASVRRRGSICIASSESQQERITYNGDCGYNLHGLAMQRCLFPS